jgi:hypothetical protein
MLPEKLDSSSWLVGMSDEFPHIAVVAQLVPYKSRYEIQVYTAMSGVSYSPFLEVSQLLYSFEFWAADPTAMLEEFSKDYVRIPDETKLYALGYLYGGTFPDRAPLIPTPSEIH